MGYSKEAEMPKVAGERRKELEKKKARVLPVVRFLCQMFDAGSCDYRITDSGSEYMIVNGFARRCNYSSDQWIVGEAMVFIEAMTSYFSPEVADAAASHIRKHWLSPGAKLPE